MKDIMPRNQKVTIKDVAEAAGVSTQTVSRVINFRPDVSPETKERVQKVIEELGYSPNVIARSLVRGRSNTIGVVGWGLGYYGPTSIFLGIEQKTHELGFSLLLSLLNDFDSIQIDDILNNLLSRQVDGIIWAVPGNDNLAGELSMRFREISLPMVYLNKRQTQQEIVVAMDNRLGGRIATQHLVDEGYQRIGIITGPTDWWEAQERESGWRDVVTEAGLDSSNQNIVNGDWSAASGEAGLRKLLAKSSDIDAVFVCNDQMALGALKASRNLEIDVPQELGIVGFDDIPEAEYFYPPLSTIYQNAEELGVMAVEQLCKIIRARRDNLDIDTEVLWAEPKLVVRNSSIR